MNIGILGAGQLAQMLALAGIPLGHRFAFYDPTPDSCAAALGRHFQAAYDDWEQLRAFAESVDVVTLEFENVPLSAIQYIAGLREVWPRPNALEAKQDRLAEKKLFQRLDIPTPQFADIDSLQKLLAVAGRLGYPLVLKSRFGGYDGKSQFVVNSAQELHQVWQQIEGQHFIAEEWVNYAREVSIIAARNPANEVEFYDLAENTHRRGVLHTTFNRPCDPLFDQACAIARQLLTELDYCGVLAVELFQVGDQLLVNEFAPRVHNSGHWTIEGAVTSQFENQLRAVMQLPLGSTRSRGFSAMINFVGELPAEHTAMATSDGHYHVYGKQAKPGRKLGHLTLVADDPGIVATQVEQLTGRFNFVTA